MCCNLFKDKITFASFFKVHFLLYMIQFLCIKKNYISIGFFLLKPISLYLYFRLHPKQVGVNYSYSFSPPLSMLNHICSYIFLDNLHPLLWHTPFPISLYYLFLSTCPNHQSIAFFFHFSYNIC